MTTLTEREQYAILQSERCHCGRSKKRKHAFCGRCFHRLAPETQSALYIRIPHFGESYERAVVELEQKEHRKRNRYIDPRQRVRAAGGAV